MLKITSIRNIYRVGSYVYVQQSFKAKGGVQKVLFLKVLVVIATGMGGGGPRLSSELLLKGTF